MPDTLPATPTDPHTDPGLIALRRAHYAQLRYREQLLRKARRANRPARVPDRDIAAIEADNGPPPDVRRSPTQQKGDYYERAALAHLRQAGLRLVARNLSCRAGEIDLVLLDGKVLVFAEVRARQSNRFGGALASVTPCKQARIKRAAAYWLPVLRRRLGHHACQESVRCRFDVLAFEDEVLHWVTHAFGVE